MRNRFFYSGFFVVALGALALYSTAVARAPDFAVSITETTETRLPPKTLDQSIQHVINWPSWFQSTSGAVLLGGLGGPLPLKDQILRKGSTIRLTLQTVGDRIQLVVADYVPERFLHLALSPDSSPHITRYFKAMEWLIEFLPSGTINATLRARPSRWESKILGVWAKHYLLEDYFFPDIRKLAALAQPKTSALQHEVSP